MEESMLPIRLAFSLSWIIFLMSCSQPNERTEADPVEPSEPAPLASNQPVRSTQDSSTPTLESYEQFWPTFQSKMATVEAASLANYVAFPLKDAQYLVGKPQRSEGIGEQEFVEHFLLIFDEEARSRIASLTSDELEPVSLSTGRYSQPIRDAAGRQFRVTYQEDDTESTVMYVFGKTAQGIKLIEIKFAG